MGDLEEKIKRELLKSGFPLQIYCQKALLTHNWNILDASEYYISETDIKKEVDVIGVYIDQLNKKTDIDYELFIECKKSEDNPWVFFRDDNEAIHKVLYSDMCAVHREWPNPSYTKGLHFDKIPSSSIYTMAFQKKNRGNQIYEAISSVLLAYHFRQEFLNNVWKDTKSENLSFSTIIVSFLTILFDGKLYIANAAENDTLELVETGNINYCYRETKSGKCYQYDIEIVNKNYFDEYLKILAKDMRLISNSYRKNLKVKVK